MKALLSVTLVIGLAGSAATLACQFDNDCSSGGRCMKDFGAAYGVCYGGLRPGNDGDRRPGPQRGDPSHTAGNTCHFDIECGQDSQCLIAPSGRDGVCVAN